MYLSLKTFAKDDKIDQSESQSPVSYSVMEERIVFPNDRLNQTMITSSSICETQKKFGSNPNSPLTCEHIEDILWIDGDDSCSDTDSGENKVNSGRLTETGKSSVALDVSKTSSYFVKGKVFSPEEPLSQNDITDIKSCNLHQPANLQAVNNIELAKLKLNHHDKCKPPIWNFLVDSQESRKLYSETPDPNPTRETPDVVCLQNSIENSERILSHMCGNSYWNVTGECVKQVPVDFFRIKSSFPDEQLTLFKNQGLNDVKDDIGKSIPQNDYVQNIFSKNNTERLVGVKHCTGTKVKIKRREALRSSVHYSLRPIKSPTPSKVAALTESTLGALYHPFHFVRTQLVRQARDILLCQFLGDFRKFCEEFLLPAGSLLQRIQFKTFVTGSYPFCGEQSWKAWPLCFQQRVVVQLSEIDRAFLRVGDHYFCLRSERTRELAGEPQYSLLLTCVYRDYDDIKERVINEKCFDKLFTMDWIHDPGTSNPRIGLLSNPESDEYLPTLLQHLLVTVERGIERIECESLRNPRIYKHVCSDPSTALNNPVAETKDISVQTRLLNVTVDDTTENSCNHESCTSSSLDGQGNCLRDSPVVDCPADLSTHSDSEENSSKFSQNFENQERCPVGLSHSSCSTENRGNHVDISEPVGDYSVHPETALSSEAVKESLSIEKPIPASDGHSLVTTGSSPEGETNDVCKETLNNTLLKPRCISQVDPDLLHTEIAYVPGSRDVDGRSVMIIHCSVFRNLKVTPSGLAELFMYFHSVPRKEVATRGFCVLIDDHNSEDSDWTVLDEAFCLVKASVSNIISIILVCTENEPKLEATPLFTTSGFKYFVVVTVEKLHSFVQEDQLLPKHSGSYKYNHQEWISFRMFLEPFINGCQLLGRHLVTVMQELRGNKLPPSALLTSQIIEQEKRIINQAFQDEQLRHLVDEGDTVLKELESYSNKTMDNHDYRDSIRKARSLHNELKTTAVKLAQLADQRLKKLGEYLQVKTFEEETHQVLEWLCQSGQETLDKHQVVADSLLTIKEQEGEFEKFYFLAMQQLEKGNDLLEDATTLNQKVSNISTNSPVLSDDSGQGDVERLTVSLKNHMNTFTEHLEDTRERLEDAAKCYCHLDRSYEWALEAMKFLSKMEVEEPTSNLMKMLKSLQDYLDNHPPIPDEIFQEMEQLATKLGETNILDQCKVAHTRCQEAMELIRTRQTILLKARQHQETEVLQHQPDLWDLDSTISTNFQQHHNWIPQYMSTPGALSSSSSDFYRRRSIATSSPQNHGCHIGSYTSFPSSYHPMSGLKDGYQSHSIDDKEDQIVSQGFITEDLTTQGPIASISLSKLEARSNSAQKETNSYGMVKSSSGSSLVGLKDRIIGSIVAGAASIQISSKEGLSHHRPLKKLMKRCQTWQLCEEALQKATSEVREQNEKLTFDQIEAENVQSEESDPSVLATEESSGSNYFPKCALTQSLSDSGSSPVPVNSHLTKTVSVNLPEQKELDQEVKRKTTLLHIMGEMIQTEQDYVKSLEYIIENYIPELLREDIPQVLRGQRNVIFGNIEKIHEFHNQYFLSELKNCENLPFLVGQCFLVYESQFYLYALYNKNKPKSEALMAEYGNTFFKKKQLELGDKMDLASYLLKPVQRMGKYALLLKQLLKECPECEPEHEDLKAAEEMVKFQLRHGNDLLAMDALRECDVNLKEQGRLLRQDEFLVWQGRSRKSLRHVFLFEDLVLFSKARRDPERKNQEIYQYKHSFKMTDIGMTEQVGDSPNKFEIWFRKRKQSDTYVLQAPNPEVKQAWVLEISKLLWKQALRNREMRLAEMSSMGIGSKPCLDIKPNEDQISDRAINFQQLSRVLRFKNSFAVSSHDQLRNNKRPNSTISVSSSSSSGSSYTSFPHTGSVNLGFEQGDARFSHGCRSITQQSQCSTESGISIDLSTAGDSSWESERPHYKKAERSDSLLSNDSVITNLPISECPTAEEQMLERSHWCNKYLWTTI
ncbi:uncharacterized protein LOC143250793 isoform X3 [Tachypleus tridentatus]|uniref:uncharacterized protein LOC143250793 isoform X3 n=1 Tax=Tachypleus tridentatus TaxID=6853 RepID=UPI003FD54F1B